MHLQLINKIGDIYVDLVTEGEILQKVEKIKSDSIELFEKTGFKLQRPTTLALKQNWILQKNILEQKRKKVKYWAWIRINRETHS